MKQITKHSIRFWTIVVCSVVAVLVPVISFADGILATDVTELTITPKTSEILNTEIKDNTEVQWQIYSPDSGDYIDIAGAKSTSFKANAALISDMIYDGRAMVRAKTTNHDGQVVSYKYYRLILSQDEPDPESPTPEFGAAQTMMVSDLSNNSQNADKVKIRIRYLSEDDTPVAEDTVHDFNVNKRISWNVYLRTSKGYITQCEPDSHFAKGEVVIKDDQTLLSIECPNGLSDTVNESLIIVRYLPGQAVYKISKYLQNANDDKYTQASEDYKGAIIDSVVPTPDDIEKSSPPGFRSASYETATVTANDKTEVSIEYDRYYYNVVFDWNGGIDGPGAIRGKYGSNMPTEIKQIRRAGYSFLGWFWINPETGKEDKVDPTKQTIPLNGTTYTAHWKANDTTSVTIVYWGENADDNKPSYLFNEVKDGISTKSEYTFNPDNIKSYFCNPAYGLELGHQHTPSCFISSNDGQGTWNKASLENFLNNEFSNLLKSATSDGSLRDGYVFCQGTRTSTRYSYQYTYYTYIEKQWYVWSKSVAPTCKGSTALYTNEMNDKKKIYELYKANIQNYCTSHGGHDHEDVNSPCFQFQNKYEFDYSSDPFIPSPDGKSVCNVYLKRCTYKYQFGNNKTEPSKYYGEIVAKWGENINQKYIDMCKAKFGTDSKFWCYVKGSDSIYTNILTNMGFSNIDYYYKDLSNLKYEFRYWIQTVEASENNIDTPAGVTGDVKPQNYLLQNKGLWQTGMWPTQEEFIPIGGFMTPRPDGIYGPTLSNVNPVTIDKVGSYNMYYVRNKHNIIFNNNGIPGQDQIIETKIVNLPYEKNIAEAKDSEGNLISMYKIEEDDYELLRPKHIDKHYEFKDWYLSPNPAEGDQSYDFTGNMPDNDFVLYAHWVPKKYPVEFFQDADCVYPYTDDAGNQYKNDAVTYNTLYADNGTPVPPDFVKPGYRFDTWCYKDQNDNEQPFDPTKMTVIQDLKLYPKLTPDTPIDYTVYYKVHELDESGNEIEIATRKTGMAYEGKELEFNAKRDLELRIGYKDNYFPEHDTQNLTITPINSNGENPNQITFYYDTATVHYNVYYYEKDTTNPVADPDLNVETQNSMATVSYKDAGNGYIPHEPYTITQPLSIDESKNNIYFYYTRDDDRAMVNVNHILVDKSGHETIGYKTYEACDIGSDYTAQPITFSGYTLNELRSDLVSHEVPSTGLVLNLYYDMDDKVYEYLIHYVYRYYTYDSEGKQIPHDTPILDMNGESIDKEGEADIGTIFGPEVIPGYYSLNPSAQLVVLEGPKADNTVTFYYGQDNVTINYQVATEDKLKGEVTKSVETIKGVEGTAQGSTANYTSGFHFVCWTNQAGDIVSYNQTYIPPKVEKQTEHGEKIMVNVPDTYTAHFADNDTLGIEISKTVNPATANVGEEVAYTITVTNTSDIPLKYVRLTDSIYPDDLPVKVFNLDVKDTEGATKIVTFQHEVTAEDYNRNPDSHSVTNIAKTECYVQDVYLEKAAKADLQVTRQLKYIAPVRFDYSVDSAFKGEKTNVNWTDNAETKFFENKSVYFPIQVKSFAIDKEKQPDYCKGYTDISAAPKTVINPYQVKIQPFIGAISATGGKKVDFAIDSTSEFDPTDWTMQKDGDNIRLYVKCSEGYMRLDNKEPWNTGSRLQDVIWTIDFAD